MATSEGLRLPSISGKPGTEALGGDEQEIEAAVEVVDQAWREAARSRPEWMRSAAKAAFVELGDLIFHKGDQWADHQRGAAACDSG